VKDDPPAVPAPPLPFTLTAGDAPVRLSLLLLRRRGWVLVAIVAVGVIAAIATRDLGALIEPVGIVAVVLLVLGGVLLYQRAYGRSTITVTTTELEIRRVRRREVLARHEIDALVVGWFTVHPDPAALQVAFVDREGRRRSTAQAYYWPDGGLEQLAAALDVPLRWQDPEDKPQVPFFVRHLMLTGIAGGIALAAVIVGVIVVVDHVRAGNRDEAAVAARREFDRYANTRLTASLVPGLDRVRARSSANDAGIDLSVELDLTTAGDEADPAAVRAVHEAVCGFAPDLDGTALDVRTQITTTLTGTPPDESGEQPRRVLTLDCTAPRGSTEALLAWVDHAAAQPVGPRISYLSTDTGVATDVDLFVVLATSDVAGFTAAADQVCSFKPPGGKTVGAGLLPHHLDSSHTVELDCADRPGMLAAWQGAGS
jgi:hypothetical protein